MDNKIQVHKISDTLLLCLRNWAAFQFRPGYAPLHVQLIPGYWIEWGSVSKINKIVNNDK